MAKAILEFDLDNYEDKVLHEKMLNSVNAHLALNGILDELRKIIKYESKYGKGKVVYSHKGGHTLTEDESEIIHVVLDEIRDLIFTELEYNKINLDDL